MRKRNVTLLAMGAALSLLLGSGLFALVSDSVKSQGNEFTSGTYTASHDLKGARVASSAANCTGGTFTDGPFTHVVQTNVDLSSGAMISQTDDFCLKNNGTQAAKLLMSFTNVVETEVGACEATESAAGDPSCTAGGGGELGSVMFASWNLSAGSASGCGNLASSFNAFKTTPGNITASLPAGSSCRGFFQFAVNTGAPDADKLKAQTDKMQFEITFTLQDV